MATKIIPMGVKGVYINDKEESYGKDTFLVEPTPTGRYYVNCQLNGAVDKESLVMVRDCLNLIIGEHT